MLKVLNINIENYNIMKNQSYIKSLHYSGWSHSPLLLYKYEVERASTKLYQNGSGKFSCVSQLVHKFYQWVVRSDDCTDTAQHDNATAHHNLICNNLLQSRPYAKIIVFFSHFVLLPAFSRRSSSPKFSESIKPAWP